MVRNGDKVSIRDVYDIVGKLDEKLSKKIDDMSARLDKTHEKINERLDEHENAIVENKTKLSAVQIFQTTLSIVIGALASFLGVRK